MKQQMHFHEDMIGDNMSEWLLALGYGLLFAKIVEVVKIVETVTSAHKS